MKQFNPTESKEFPGWLEIPGYPLNCANGKGEILTKKTRGVTLGGNAGRYLKVKVYRGNDTFPTMQYVHELVCSAFFGPRQPGMIVNHKDHNKKNNKIKNLEWITQALNVTLGWAFKKKALAMENRPQWMNWSLESQGELQFLSDAFPRVQVKDAKIVSYCYDDQKKILELEHTSEVVTQYYDVPDNVFNSFVTDSNKDRFEASQLRDKFQKVEL